MSKAGPAYDSYTQWKNWEMDFSTPDEDRRYFEREVGSIAIPAARIIELGFGSGSFLNWAKNRGAEVFGVEIQESIVDAAVHHGFIAVTDLEQLVPHRRDGFDAVLAFDVLEHLSTDEIRKMLQLVDGLLKPSGTLIVRVPNGDSPFSHHFQYSDATHKSVITPLLLTQLSLNTSLRVSEIRNQARVPAHSGLLHGIGKKAQFFLRECVNQGLARIYGYAHACLDQNIVIMLRKSA